MAYGAGPGLITDGIGADSYKAGIPGIYQAPTLQQLFTGQALKRNILTVVGRNDLYTQYSQGDQVVNATSASSGFVAGVVARNSAQNLQNTNTTAQPIKASLIRQGVAPVRVAALNGGTAVTIGSYVGFSAAVGASSQDVPTVQGSYTVGAMIGVVTAFQIFTSTLAAITATGSQTVAVLNTDGITTATSLQFDYDLPTQENVTPTAVTAQVRANNNITIAGTFSAGSIITVNINGVILTYTVQASDTNAAGVAASLAKVINASNAVYGLTPYINPAQVSGAVVYLTAANAGTPANAYTLTSSVSGGTVTATTATGTFTGGAYGTITAPFAFTHASAAVILGQNITSGATLIPTPAATAGINIDTVLVDVALVGA